VGRSSLEDFTLSSIVVEGFWADGRRVREAQVVSFVGAGICAAALQMILGAAAVHSEMARSREPILL